MGICGASKYTMEHIVCAIKNRHPPKEEKAWVAIETRKTCWPRTLYAGLGNQFKHDACKAIKFNRIAFAEALL